MKMNAVLAHSVMNSQLVKILLQTSHAHAMMDILEMEHIAKVCVHLNLVSV